MKERPILFSASMVRAILDGTKTQTRRLVKLRDKDLHDDTDFLHGGSAEVALAHGSGSIGEFREQDGQWFGLTGYHTVCNIVCPYGQPGDRLWVREICRAEELPDEHEFAEDEFAPGTDGVRYLADNDFIAIGNSMAASERWIEMHAYAGKKGATVPAIHMPRWASRITLEIVSVRVERLQDINEADCIAEGVTIPVSATNGHPLLLITGKHAPCKFLEDIKTANSTDWFRAHYAALWESINGEGSWAANPWAWAVEFKRISQ